MLLWLLGLQVCKRCSRWHQTELESTCLGCSRASLHHWVVVKESTAFISRLQAWRTGSSCSEDLNSLMAFRGGVLKVTFGVRVAACGLSSDWLVAG